MITYEAIGAFSSLGLFVVGAITLCLLIYSRK